MIIAATSELFKVESSHVFARSDSQVFAFQALRFLLPAHHKQQQLVSRMVSRIADGDKNGLKNRRWWTNLVVGVEAWARYHLAIDYPTQRNQEMPTLADLRADCAEMGRVFRTGGRIKRI